MLNEFVEKIPVHGRDRKGSLHQNYLRRKANGKVAEGYERTKAKKKAEMDAKKNTI